MIKPLDRLQVAERFHLAFPKHVQAEIAKIVVSESRLAQTRAKASYAKDQAKELQPRLRRAGIESRLLGLMGQFPSIISKSERSGGSSYAARVESGGVILLCVRATKPDAPLKPSAYRQDVLFESAQFSFALEPERPVPTEAKLFATLLYGGNMADATPAFARIRFPAADYHTYLDSYVDLKAEFPAVFADATNEEQITTTLVEMREREIIEDQPADATEVPVEEIMEVGSIRIRATNTDTGSA